MNVATLAAQLGAVSFDGSTEQQIAEKLRAAIMCMDLPPGAQVSEGEIGQAVGVSRTPVRAALARLRSEGLIETRPSRGNFVTLMSPSAIREAQFIRHALEHAIVVHLCNIGISDPDIAVLQQTIASGAAAIDADDRVAFQRLDNQFHAVMARATGHRRLPEVVEREKTLLDRLRVLSLSDADHQRCLLDDHRAILEAVLAQDEARACAAVTRHLSRVLTTLTTLVARNATYFEPSEI